MSYLENLTPKHALESLGLRREDPNVMMEAVLPGVALFLLGACFGAGAALLLAPKSGRELRDDISTRATELKATVRNALPGHEEAPDAVDGHYRAERS